jgi:hypothetical protein
MTRLTVIIIAAAVVISLAVVGYVLRKPMKEMCKKVWNVMCGTKRQVVSKVRDVNEGRKQLKLALKK